MSTREALQPTNGAKDREAALKEAKKKLKKYRAKQAQSKRLSAVSGHTSSSSVTGQVIVDAMEASTSAAAAVVAAKRASMTAAPAPSHIRSHSRTASRAGHGRGHSRAGSISITAQSLTAAVVAAAAPSSSTISAAPARASASFVVATPTSHIRGHSRSGSIAALGKARAHSMIGGLAPGNSSRRSSLVQPLEWTEIEMQKSSSQPALSSLSSPRASDVPVSASASTQAPFPSSPLRSSIQVQPTTPVTQTHARRPSRHARRTSVSTKRESMEIMGGLTLNEAPQAAPSFSFGTPAADRASRRFSSHRTSGLLPASVLFGSSPGEENSSHKRRSSQVPELDWGKALGVVAAEDSSDDRLTALQKLEGRSSNNRLSVEGGLRSPMRTEQRLSGSGQPGSRSSVQLPAFDDVHGAERMDAHKSLSLLSANEETTSQERAGSEVLGVPVAADGATSSPPAPTSPGAPSNRPTSVYISPDSVHVEGLGTLVEEEEEEDDGASSPTKTRAGSPDREAARLETIKKNRRDSLTPKPLKLKSRPASLFFNPSTLRSQLAVAHSPNVAEEEGEETADAAPAPSTDDSAMVRSGSLNALERESSTPSEWSMAGAQAKLAEARASVATQQQQQQRQRPVATPEMKRAWRSSMPVVPGSAPAGLAGFTPTPLTSTPPARPGMRQLRLGSTSGSISEAVMGRHQGASESISSVSSSSPSVAGLPASSSSTTIPIGSAVNRRASLIGMPSAPAREDLGQGLPGLPSSSSGGSIAPLGFRRSSIIYKSSKGSTGPDASSSSLSGSISSLADATATTPTASAGVPLAVYEELKAAQQRNISQLEDFRKQVERLRHELTVEGERSAREYAELERWSAEEKRSLGARIEHLEADAAQSTNARRVQDEEAVARIDAVEAEKTALAERLEDAEAERDMLQEDVDGWRTRCGDLEKSLRGEKANTDRLRRAHAVAKSHVRTLIEALEAAGVPVPAGVAGSQEMSPTDDSFPADLVSALRSPALGSSSPVMAAAGYFSMPVGGTSPGAVGSPFADPSAPPPPQAVKLLKDMRQQIFNLAGSLEHERKMHLAAQEQVGELRRENERLAAAGASAVAQGDITVATAGDKTSPADEHDIEHSAAADTTMTSVESGDHDDDKEAEPTNVLPPPPSGPARNHSQQDSSTTSSPRRVVVKNKHVFAYDSSLGSASMSMGSSSGTGSGAGTEHFGRASMDTDKDHAEAFHHEVEGVAVTVEDDAAAAAAALGGLQTLAEAAEEEEAAESVTEAATPNAHSIDVASEATVADVDADDVEAQASADIERSSFESDADSVVPPTPGLEQSHSFPPTADAQQEHRGSSYRGPVPVLAVEGQVIPRSQPGSIDHSNRSSSESSADSRGPASPPNGRSDAPIATEAAIAAAAADADAWVDEDIVIEVDEPTVEPRPEFIPEWSFAQAFFNHAQREKQVQEKMSVAKAQAASRAARVRRKMDPVDDFFGIMQSYMHSRKLSALPVPDEALEMPPVYVEASAPAYSVLPLPQQPLQQSTSYDSAPPRFSARVSSRPPIAKSAFTRDSWSVTTAHPSAVEEGQVGLVSSNSVGGGYGASLMSRVSLQGLTSAFSGLGGYLTGQSNPVVSAAAAATRTCSPTYNGEDEEADSHDQSASWTAARRADDEEEAGWIASNANAGAARASYW